MEYLLSWVFDHFIDNIYIKNVNIINIEKLISEHISEIDFTEKIIIEKEKLFIAEVQGINIEFISLRISELNKEIKLTIRNDAKIGLLFLVKEIDNFIFEWAKISDFGAKRENLIPAFKIDNKEDLSGKWKDLIENVDYLIKIDNKSIGNRPDLFSHRGLARELSYFINTNLKKEEELTINVKLTDINNENKYKNILKNNCKSVDFCAISILENISESECRLNELIRLCMVDVRPKSFLVDLSNYVMLDIGHPMHVFDKNKINEFIKFENNKNNELLGLLDGTNINILEKDIVISDKTEIISLAGIMGGAKTAVSIDTKSIIIEAGSFDKNVIKNSVKNHNKRTESSTRFEKGLNKNGAVLALKRFIKMLSLKENIKETEIIFDGSIENKINLIELFQSDIEKILGNVISSELIVKIATKLEFKIEKIIKNNNIFYKIEVPWWRSDINIKEDFIEEISRYIGYNNIKQISPNINFDLIIKKEYFVEKVKNWAVNSFKGVEVLTYGILNEEIAKTLGLNTDKLIALKNGYSEIQNKLISSLLPHMMHILQEEVKNGNKEIRIFEVGQIWTQDRSIGNLEEKVFSIVWFHDDNLQFDFYSKKNLIEDFFINIGIKLDWKKYSQNKLGLFSQIASSLYFKDNFIGSAGFIDPEKVFSMYKSKGSVFALEIYYERIEMKNDFIDNYNKLNYFFDLSFLILKEDSLVEYIEKIKSKIDLDIKIYEIDWFEKPEWKDKRSVTIRIYFKNLSEREKLKYCCELILQEIGCIVR